TIGTGCHAHPAAGHGRARLWGLDAGARRPLPLAATHLHAPATLPAARRPLRRQRGLHGHALAVGRMPYSSCSQASTPGDCILYALWDRGHGRCPRVRVWHAYCRAAASERVLTAVTVP